MDGEWRTTWQTSARARAPCNEQPKEQRGSHLTFLIRNSMKPRKPQKSTRSSRLKTSHNYDPTALEPHTESEELLEVTKEQVCDLWMKVDRRCRREGNSTQLKHNFNHPLLFQPFAPSTPCSTFNRLQPSSTLFNPLQPSSTLFNPRQPSATLFIPLQPLSASQAWMLEGRQERRKRGRTGRAERLTRVEEG